MIADYRDFLAAKRHVGADHGFQPLWLPEWLFDFQRHLVTWAIRKGRAALLTDCGTGKAAMALVWAENVRRHTGRPVLILTPLAVAFQMCWEAGKFGIDAAISRTGTVTAPITVANYERMHRFNPDDFGGVVCDEASILKAFDGPIRAAITEFVKRVLYRLLCTATAAPNNYIELGTLSEALGELGYTDMLGRFFVNDSRSVKQRLSRSSPHGSEQWRFKGHAEAAFWPWVGWWARAMRRPSDLGFPDDGFVLPALVQRQHVVSATSSPAGMLFAPPAFGLREERDESRRTIAERCQVAADLLADAPCAVAWCHLNAEGDELTRRIDGAVQVSGSDDADRKEEVLRAFGEGEIRVLVTKPTVAGWGLNWQHCHRMSYFPSHSYEQLYQAVRRSWRFGQKDPVTIDFVTTPGNERMLENLQRKAGQADRMFAALVASMREAVSIERAAAFAAPMEVPPWLLS